MSFRVEGLENDEDAPRHISHVEEDDVQVDKNISLSVAEVKVSILLIKCANDLILPTT